jgi:hypothetical protein
VLTDLGAAAPSLGRFVLELGPFSRSANVSLTSLGKATDVGGPVLQRAQPVVNDLKNFAQTANPVSKNLDDLTASLDKTGGIEQFMNYIFFQMTAINGFDSLGHYLRAGLLVNVCSTYVTTQQPGCAATFRTPTSVTSAATAAKAGGKGGKAAAKAEKTPSQALGGVLKGLLDLARRRQAGSLKTNSAATHVQQSAARGGSAALDGVGGRDAALLQYLMADG